MKKTPRELVEYYKDGGNISELIRRERGINFNTKDIIEISYDLQTGSYIDTMFNPDMVRHKKEYTLEIARIILSLCNPASILEAGVGEATTFSGVLENLGIEINSYGFDLSWSRLAYARKWLRGNGISNTSLCSGDLHNIPFMDNSIDVVYTSHSIESNGGNEEPIIKELFRVTRKYLLLLEPAYELANSEAKVRMESHGD
jgi:ubiquinone/menaquinone biosynthesis C-methylase UbiE